MAENAEIVFTLETQEARKQVDRLKRDLKETAEVSESIFSRETIKRNASLFGGAAAGAAIGALSSPGAGLADAGFAASRQIQQTLQQQAQANIAAGIASGNKQQLGIGAAQGVASVVMARNLEPINQARESAISQAAALTDPFARAGIQTDPQLQKDIIQVAFTQAMRSIQNTAQARRVAGDMESILQQIGGGF